MSSLRNTTTKRSIRSIHNVHLITPTKEMHIIHSASLQAEAGFALHYLYIISTIQVHHSGTVQADYWSIPYDWGRHLAVRWWCFIVSLQCPNHFWGIVPQMQQNRIAQHHELCPSWLSLSSVLAESICFFICYILPIIPPPIHIYTIPIHFGLPAS